MSARFWATLSGCITAVGVVAHTVSIQREALIPQAAVLASFGWFLGSSWVDRIHCRGGHFKNLEILSCPEVTG